MAPLSDSETNSVIFLLGPTAAGKTDLALALVEKVNCEIISVDSAQIYRGMDIGTAKPEKPILENIPHHLVDIKDPTESYSAMEFADDARALIRDIHNRGKTPLLTGGTMMYCQALLQGMADMPEADQVVRDRLMEQLDQHGHEFLYQRLQQVDPIAASKMPAQNTQRLLRALEIYEITGRPISEFWQETTADFPWPSWQIAVAPTDRAVLHERINLRFDLMLNQGFEAEVQALVERGDLHAGLSSIKCVGYRQMWQYLTGELGYDEMVDKGKAASRQLAKRQFTWLRKWPQLHWLETGSDNLVDQALKILTQSPSKL